MLRKAFGFGIAAMLPFVVASAVLTPRPVTVSMPGADAATTIEAPDPPSADNNSEGAPDLFGNPVSDAVARYNFDATGSLYELHSPQTEVPRLKPPKT